MLLEDIVPIGFHKPKPNQLAVNNLNKFKFKKGDAVQHRELPGVYGIIYLPVFFHESESQKGHMNYIPSQNKENGYQEYLDALQENGNEPFSLWYYIKWKNFGELEQERGTDIGLEAQSVLIAIPKNTNNLERLR